MATKKTEAKPAKAAPAAKEAPKKASGGCASKKK